MDYKRRDDGRVLAEGRCEGVVFSAKNIRRSNTGVHALIGIGYQGYVLTHHVFNVERQDERTKMVNAAYKKPLPPINGKKVPLVARLGTEYPSEQMLLDLDAFTWGLWDFFIGRFDVEQVGGLLHDEPPTFVFDPYVIEEAGTILFGPYGGGKSATALTIAVAVDEGVTCAYGIPTDAVPVLFINLERGKRSMEKRLTRVNLALGLDRRRKLWMLNARGRSLADVMAVVSRRVRELKIGLVIVDSISRAGAGDLNENETANTIVDMLNGLGVSWLGIGHTPDSNDKKLYGSIHFGAGADVMVNLRSVKKEDHTLGITLEATKANDMPWPPKREVAIEFNPGLGLTKVRAAEEDEFKNAQEVAVADKKDLKRDLVTALQDIEYATASGLCDYIGDRKKRSAISRLLANDDAFTFHDKVGREKRYRLSVINSTPTTADTTVAEPAVQSAVQTELGAHDDAQFVCGACSEPAEGYDAKGANACAVHMNK